VTATQATDKKTFFPITFCTDNCHTNKR